ncbi:MAG: cytochrome c oxidase subunit IV [Arenicella sp.]|jgi:cytochrome c oxidase subunit IV
MGIIVCITMLLGLSVLQPSPWDSAKRLEHAPKLVLFTALLLFCLGLWNALYGYFSLSGFWSWASVVSGSAMLCASLYVYSERKTESGAVHSASLLRKAVISVLAISFVVYAVTLIQLNLGYAIIR